MARNHGQSGGGTAALNAVLPVLQQGVGHHQSGSLDLAVQCYEQVLSRVPGQADALHLLGVVHHQNGDHSGAIDLISKSVKANPKNADAHSNLGAAMVATGDVDGAVRAFQRAVKLNPRFLDAHTNLAVLAMRQGRDKEAIKEFRRAHQLKPDDGHFMKRLADLYLKTGQFAEALDWYARLIAQAGGDPESHNNAGFACERLDRLDEAEQHYRQAVQLDPAKPESANNLASVLARLGRGSEAQNFIEQALGSPRDAWEDPANLAGALFNQGRIEEALDQFRLLVEQRPADAALRHDFGVALFRSGDIDAAERALRDALELDPQFDKARIELARCLLLRCDLDAAIDQLDAIAEDSPHFLSAALDHALILAEAGELDDACAVARRTVGHPDFRPSMFVKPLSVFRAASAFDDLSTLQGSLDDVEDYNLSKWAGVFLELLTWADTEEKIDALVTLHRRWGENLMASAAGGRMAEIDVSARTGPIRLGFVSSDLRKHSVARFVLPLFENYDRDTFEIYCYSPRDEKDDEIQRRIKRLVHEFRIVGDQSHLALAQTIRDDQIDILFELNGFTAESRQAVMAFRPAPVQICWLGYPFTRGLEAMDYILLDDATVPDRADWSIETPLVMPGSFVCYDPFEPTRPALEPPVARNGYVTFGTLNNPYKFTRDMIALWAEAMNRTPGSRYMFAHMSYEATLVVENISTEFERHGVDRDRLSFVNNRGGGLSHFAFYDEIDLTLDSFPLTGGTTSCDALWMGVPIVTLVGPAIHQRLTYTMLQNLGLDELCAFDRDAFVEIAANLAADRDRLMSFRRNLRPMMQNSCLGQPEKFGREFSTLMKEVAVRHGLWKQP